VPAAPSSHESRADVLLREALGIIEPLARALISHGVTYPVFAQALKSVFLVAARAELEQDGRRMTDSALSLLSGVHRKDVRAFAASEHPPRSADPALSMAAQVFARWMRDPAYADAAGQPRALAIRAGDGPSFEALAQSVSKDFHARSVLDELLRLELVDIADETVTPRVDQFTPAAGFSELAYYFGANVHDHLAAGAANLRAVHQGVPPRFLEHALFADGLSEQSVSALQDLARQVWKQALKRMYAAATTRVDQDEAAPGGAPTQRVRFGAFFYAEPQPASAPTAPPGDSASTDAAPEPEAPR